MINCTSFSAEIEAGQVKITYQNGKKQQSIFAADQAVRESVNTIFRFISENGDISEESLKPRRY